jgi:hypothetical protein
MQTRGISTLDAWFRSDTLSGMLAGSHNSHAAVQRRLSMAQGAEEFNRNVARAG